MKGHRQVFYQFCKTIAAATLILAAAGCETPPTGQPAASSAPPPAAAPNSANGDEALLRRIGPLDRRKMEEGECGLFLWAAVPDRQLVFFQRGSTDQAEMSLDGTIRQFTRVRAEGSPIFGLFPSQSFREQDIDLTLSLSEANIEPVTKGAVIRRASLRVAEKQGWAVVLSVAGLIACQ